VRRRDGRAIVARLAFLLLAAPFSLVVGGQEPILRFSVSPDDIAVVQGGLAELRLRIENMSIREADDIAVSWAGGEGFALDPEPEEIEVLAPFETATLTLRLSAFDVAEGEHEGGLQVLYTYCISSPTAIDDQCFQFVETLEVDVLVAAAPSPDDGVQVGPVAQTQPVTPTPPSSRAPFPWPWVGLGAAALAVAGLLAGVRGTVGRRIATAGLVLVIAGGLAYGVAKNQHGQARSIASVLCISCVGLEEAQRAEDVRLSTAAVEALERLAEDVELTVFYAEWCHSCPYAERMVERMAQASDRISFRFVDVEAAPDEAARAGIVESDRTIVPAVVRSGSTQVLFGTEDLEARLLELMGVGP